MRTIKLTTYGTEYKLAFVKSSYANNGNIAIQVMCQEEGQDYWEPFSTLTVNLDLLLPDYAFLDTNNNPRELINYLRRNRYVRFTGRARTSGWCEYPLVEIEDKFYRLMENNKKGMM